MDIQDFVPVKMCKSDKDLVEELQSKYLELAGMILERTAASPHQTVALRHLLDSKMSIVHAISHQ